MRINKILKFIALAALLLIGAQAHAINTISQGGTATSTPPPYGFTYVGGKNGELEFAATSSFGGGGSGAVSSVFGRTGAVVATAGDYTTALVTEVTNLYFTNARAIAATLTGFSATTGAVTSSDTILVAIEKLAGNAASYLTNITGLVTAGANVTITGAGTVGSPYVVNSSGGSGSPGGASSTVQYNANGAFAGNTGLVYTGTNVGIGSSTPGSLLSLGTSNGINFSTATSTFNSTGGINIKNGCYAVNGVCNNFFYSTGSNSIQTDQFTTFTESFTLGTVASFQFLNPSFSQVILGTDPYGDAQGVALSGLAYDGTTLSIDPAHANTFTALQKFNGNASTTQLTVSGNSYLADNVGIGTTTLPAALTVTNNSTLDGYFINTGTSGSGGGAGMSGLTAFLPSSGDRLAFLTGGYWNGSSAMNSTAIQSVATQNWTAGSAEGTALNFQVTPNGTASRATALTIDQDSFMGIGTTTPGSLFSVQGVANFSTATSTFSSTGGVNLLSGCYAINGTCIGSGGGGGAVSSVSNSDSTLTISPTTGSVVASLNLSNSNTWLTNQAIQSTAATALAVGANGATNPVLQVDASTASVATGISIKGAATGGATTITAIDSSANSSITMVPKGTGLLTLQGGTGGTGVAVESNAGTSKMSVFSTGIGFVSPAVVSTQTGVTYAFTGNTGTGQSAGVELTGFDINLGQIKQHATGALFQNRDMIFIPSTQSFVGASTLTNAAAVSISGEPAAGTNATITNSMGLQIATTTLTSGVTNGIGLAVSAPTGSTNSYAASTTGRLVMNALTSSASLQSGILCLSSTNEVINESVACLASARRYKEQITDFAPQTALDQILALNPVNYIYKPDFNGALQSNPNYSREQLGLIADDVIKVNPAFGLVETATTTFEGKTYAPGTAAAVDYNEVDAALVGAVQAQQKEIAALQGAAVKDVQDGWQDGFIVFLLITVGYLYLEVRKLKRI